MGGTRKYVGQIAVGGLWNFVVWIDGDTVEQNSDEYKR